MARPSNALLAFLGVAVGSGADEAQLQPRQSPVDAGQLARSCSDAIARAMPQLCDTLRRHFDARFDALAGRLETERSDNIVNLNVRSPKRPTQQAGREPQAAIAAVGGGMQATAHRQVPRREAAA